MDKSKSIIIFGASDDSKRLIGELYSTVLCELIDIVAICDNDSRIHGNQINGIVIIPPSELVNYEYEKKSVTLFRMFFLERHKKTFVFLFFGFP